MVSAQILQQTIDRYQEITGFKTAVCDPNGKLLAAAKNMQGEYMAAAAAFAMSKEEKGEQDGYFLQKVFDEGRAEYILAAKAGASAWEVLSLIAFHLESLITAYREKLDKDNFVKNLLLDNLLLVDIYNRAKKLKLSVSAKRAVMIAETGEGDGALEALIRRHFSGHPEDFVTKVDAGSLAIVHEIQDRGAPYGELSKTAETLSALLSEEGFSIRLAYGAVAEELKDVSDSYKEAKLALDVGRIFFAEKRIVAYNHLGIGRLIFQLPVNLCRLFLKEIFEGKDPEVFDEETLQTINRFFENSLNVSETARQLFIHRNTLVYRLDKLQKSTGLDLRVFDDAITFKIALMVEKYIEYTEKMNY